ncbi:tetratricopeptide repeat protein [bacterium]|nr:tetratricopeptide repeat protein [bacterium]
MREPDRSGPQEFQQQAGRAPLPSLVSSSDTEAMGDFHFSSENYTLALEYFEQAYQNLQNEGPRAELWRLAFKLGESYHRKGLDNEAREWFYLAQARLKGRETSLEFGLVLDRIGMVHLYTSSPEEALQFCFQAYELLKNSSLHSEVAENLNRIAIIYSRLGYPREAEEFFTDALVTYRRIDDHRGVIGATMNLGLLKKNACDFEGALVLFNKSMALAKQHSLHGVRISLLLNIGIVYFKQGRHRDASEMCIRARRLAREAGDEGKAARATSSLGRVQIQLGNFRRAEQLLLESRVLAEKNRQQRSLALADEFLGELAEAKGDLEAALANYELALGLARQIAPKGDVVVELLQRIARVQLKQGLPLEALRSAERGLKLTESNGELFEVPHLYRTQARAWLRLESSEKAEAAFRNALQAFQHTREQGEEDRTKLEYCGLLFARRALEDALRARKLLEDLLQHRCDETCDRFCFEASLLLACVESWLGDLDRALLAVFDAEGYLPADADAAEREELDRVRLEVEQRKIAQGGSGFGFLPGAQKTLLGGREDLPEDLRRAWRSLFELCDADAGCLCMDGADGGPFEFLEGMTRAEVAGLRESGGGGESAESAGSAGSEGPASSLLFQPLVHSGKEMGFLCLWRRRPGEPGFSREMVRYIAGFARMVTLIACQERERLQRHSVPLSELPEATQHIITRDPGMLELLHLTGKVAETDAWVLLSGETGTGKGVLAYAIHRLSNRRDRRFVHVNCAALPEELLESELFGHVRGSFTGAIHDKPGLIEEANGGTLFLDEVGKTSLKMQAKLLQFLDTREIRRVGANDSIPVNVRLITATKTDLKELSRQGRFLEDLYYRLNDFPLRMPPLRERVGDVALLAEYFLDRYGADFGKHLRGISQRAMLKLESHAWPGNVRELEKVIKRALLLSPDEQPLASEAIVLEDTLQGAAKGQVPGLDLNLKRQVGELERQLLVEALEQAEWNRTRACRSLGISYPTLLQKIRKYDLDV